ncbi:MAG TPA: LPXTG cell wall anchor domain-containing protein [Candidatus Eremiobacteraceae bacterium]|nr:LPXTG cell wall anchor domain-containing protein [Candidatus Eremiobacteraceae bacterium]
MRNIRTLFCLLATLCFGAAVLPSARADQWNKQTKMTFSQDVEIPGKILPAGTYTFKLLDSPADRHIVQIFDADGTHLITTVMAINDYRLKPTGETVVKFTERPGDAPEALRAWFYPGDDFGQAFVYPKKRAMELAQSNKYAVPSSETTDENSMKTSTITAYDSEQKELELDKAVQSAPTETRTEVVKTPEPVATPAPVTTAQTTTPAPVQREELPKTGSSMPLIALLGALSISLAFALKLFVKLGS